MDQPSRPRRSSAASPSGTSSNPSGRRAPAAADAGESTDRERIGSYTILGEIAAGAMGEVFRVWDPDLHRELALKLELAAPGSGARPTARRAGRFLEEARIAGKLDHPGIVPVHQLGTDDQGRSFFSMRLVEGETLEAIFHRVSAGDPQWTRLRTLGLLLKVCETMAYAHHKGVVHRDLKPANVMVGRFGQVYVMDWGLARVMGEEDRRDLRPVAPDVLQLGDAGSAPGPELESPVMTMDGDVLGTPAFMSPEQARGEIARIGPATDVYALGAVLYNLLSDCMPYVDPATPTTARVVWENVQSRPPRPLHELAPDTPPELVAIAEKAMARRIEDRYPDTSALAEDLRAYLEGHVVSAHQTGALAEFRKWVQRNRGVALTISGLLLLLVVGSLTAAFVLDSQRREVVVALETTQLARSRESDARVAAEAAEAEAETALAASLWQAYIANLSAARTHLEAGEHASARLCLDTCEEELRGWEWARLDFQQSPELLRLEGHPALTRVGGVAFSQDGRRVATAGIDGRILVWDSVTGEQQASLEVLDGPLNDLLFTVDGRRLISAGWGSSVRFWDAASGALLAELRGHGAEVLAVALDDANGRLASASRDGSVRIWDTTGGEMLAVLRGATGAVNDVAFSPDGALVAFGDDAGTLHLREWSNDHELFRQAAHEGPCSAVAFHASGGLVASAGSNDAVVRLWDAERGVLRHSLEGNQAGVRGLCFADGGAALVSGGEDGTLHIWDVGSGRPRNVLSGHLSTVVHVACGSDGSTLVSASHDGTGRLWSLDTRVTPTQTAGSAGIAACVDVSPDGTRLVSGSLDGPAVLRDAVSGEPMVELASHGRPVVSVAFAAGGQRVVTGGSLGMVRVSDLSGEGLMELHPGLGVPAFVTVSPDGTRVAAALGGRGTRARDAEGVLFPALSGETDVLIWDVATGAELLRLTSHRFPVTAVAFTPDGRHLLSGSKAGKIHMHDTTSGDLVLRLDQAPDAGHGPLPAVSSLAPSPDGRRLVSAHLSRLHPLVVWDLASGERLYELAGHEKRVWAALITPDGRRIVSTGEDETTRVWDLERGSLLATLRGPGLSGLCLAMGADGRRLLSTGRDGSVWIWDTDAEQARPLWQGVALSREAADLVTELLAEHVLPRLVVAALGSLEAAPGLSPELRAAAIRQAYRLPAPSVRGLNEAAWNVVQKPGDTLARYERALEQVSEAFERAPDEPGLRNTMGLALYRVGRWEQALDAFTLNAQLAELPESSYDATYDHLLAAMCRWQLGQGTPPDPLVRELRERLAARPDLDLAALLAEALGLGRP